MFMQKVVSLTLDKSIIICFWILEFSVSNDPIIQVVAKILLLATIPVHIRPTML